MVKDIEKAGANSKAFTEEIAHTKWTVLLILIMTKCKTLYVHY